MFTADGDSENWELFRTVRVDPDISGFLENNNISYSGRIDSNFIGTLLSLVVPVFLFLGIWLYMIKRLQQKIVAHQNWDMPM
jgi:cell division protease FtsH